MEREIDYKDLVYSIPILYALFRYSKLYDSGRIKLLLAVPGVLYYVIVSSVLIKMLFEIVDMVLKEILVSDTIFLKFGLALSFIFISSSIEKLARKSLDPKEYEKHFMQMVFYSGTLIPMVSAFFLVIIFVFIYIISGLVSRKMSFT
jgi:hypothetical protein